MGALCRDDGTRPRSSHVLGVLPPAGSPPAHRAQCPVVAGASRRTRSRSTVSTDESLLRTGSTHVALLYPSENRFNSGPSRRMCRTHRGAEGNTWPPAGLSAQISSVHPFVNYFFFLL